MRLLTLLIISLYCCSCSEKAEIRVATAEDDFITGTFDGRSFKFAAQNSYEALDYYFVEDKVTSRGTFVASYFNPGLFPEQGLYVGRMDDQQKEIVYFIVPENELHLQTFPYTVASATLSLAKFDYGTGGCPHPDLSTAKEIGVALTITSWDEKYLIGTFAGLEDDQTKGVFQVAFSRPE